MCVSKQVLYAGLSKAGGMLLELLGQYTCQDERLAFSLLRDADPNTGVEFPLSAQIRAGRRIVYRDLLSASYLLRFSERFQSPELALFHADLLMKNLLSRGADPNVLYVDPALGTSATLLHHILSDETRMGSEYDRPSGVNAARLLLYYGASPDIPNALSFTARDIARMNESCDPVLRQIILDAPPAGGE